jgi:hypothetical protein
MERRLASAGLGVGCALLAVLVGVAGCGVKRIATSGTVTLDGQPMPEGILQFIPDSSKGNNLRLGCSGPVSNGRWNLVTSGMARADTGTGAPVGWFKVIYTHPTEGSKAPGASAAPNVALKYRSEQTTPISIELTDPPPAEGYKIELTSK